MKKIMLLLTIFAVVTITSATAFTANKDYTIINANAPKQHQVDVIEFFSYGCPWCSYIDPSVEKWLKTKPHYVKFSRIPLTFEQNWNMYAKAYYLAEALGIERKITPKLFVAIHGKNDRQHNDLSSIEKITAFFVANGVKKDTVTANLNTSSMELKINAGKTLMKKYKIFAIPAFVIAGKYSVNLGQAKSPEKLMKTVDYLITKAHIK